MQNRYTGDVGDFGKYGLLRHLTGQREAPTSADAMRLGVVWYLYPDESHNDDGKYTGYLASSPKNHAEFRACDPDLYDSMRHLVETNRRSVAAVQRSLILPDDTLYFEPSLSFPRQMPRSERKAARASWFDGALEATIAADVIFVDPDNSVVFDPAIGIPPSVDQLGSKGPKYVFTSDLRRFYEHGQSLVIYHHLARWDTHINQIEKVAQGLKSSLGLSQLPIRLRYGRGTGRVYFIVPQKEHEATLDSRASSLLASPWSSHFDRVV